MGVKAFPYTYLGAMLFMSFARLMVMYGVRLPQSNRLGVAQTQTQTQTQDQTQIQTPPTTDHHGRSAEGHVFFIKFVQDRGATSLLFREGPGDLGGRGADPLRGSAAAPDLRVPNLRRSKYT